MRERPPVKLGLAGGSYLTQSIIADSSRTINWYPELIESGRGVVNAVLYPTPGLSLFCTAGDGPSRGFEFINGNLIWVSGNKVYYVDYLGNVVGGVELGIVDNDLKQCSLASNTFQTLIISAGKGYILQGGILTIIADAAFPGNQNGVRALKCGYIDGYFFVLADNNLFYISALNNGTSWSLIDASSIEVSANKLVSMIIDHNDVQVFGSRITQGLYNSGNPVFPFDEIPSGTVEQGTGAPDSIAKIGGVFYMLAETNNGGGTVQEINGSLPTTVSDYGCSHLLQRAIKAGSDVSSAVGWTYQIDKHDFYVLNVPGLDTTPVYDKSTKLWHELAYWNTISGKYEPHRGINHIYAFGKHLVGDRSLGLMYNMDIETYTDNSNVIRRLRRCPHINSMGRMLGHEKLRMIMKTGVGLDVAEDAAGYDPQLTLEFSDDAGVTFPNTMSVSIGKIGEFRKIVEFSGLGSTDNDRVYQLIATDPVPYQLIESLIWVK